MYPINVFTEFGVNIYFNVINQGEIKFGACFLSLKVKHLHITDFPYLYISWIKEFTFKYNQCFKYKCIAYI